VSRITPHRVAVAVVSAVVAVSAGAWLGPTAGQARKATGDAARSYAGRIAFSAGTHPQLDVYVVSSEGSGLQRLTSGAAGEFDPSWSPDGRLIAYRLETRESTPEIYVMRADGSRKRNLTGRWGSGISPAWSPDARTIAFATVRRGPLTELWVMKPDGSGKRRVGRVNGEYPDWSPDGRRIVFDHLTSGSDWDIWVVNANGSGAKPLDAWRGSREQGAAWSPDGAWIAFQSDRDASDGLPRVWIARADGSHARRLASRPGERPAWSPDGTRVLFTAGGLFVARRDGASLREVAVAAPGEASLADWGR
jgi:TolB protein